MSRQKRCRYEGGWIHPGEHDANHHVHWNEALESAVEKVPAHRSGPFAVQGFVTVSHDSPGWVDGYKIVLSTDD